MAALLQNTVMISFFLVMLRPCGFSFAGRKTLGTREGDGLEIKCGEMTVRITVKRQFFEKRHIPFKPEYLRLGSEPTYQTPCAPNDVSDSEMVVSAGLQQCGTESTVHGEWLVYFNQLVLLPAAAAAATTSSVVVRGSATVIPIECRYKRRQTVNGQPLTPTWLPMTSTISVFGLLRFSLRLMSEGCTSLRTSSVYQQGEEVFLEARVEDPLHLPLTVYVDHCVATLKPDPLSLPSYEFITKHGCLIDSVLPGSSSKFLPRDQDNRLCFSVHAFHFNNKFGEQMFITCHLRTKLKEDSNSLRDKACFFHKPTFSWQTTEGDNSLCASCDTDDCFRQTGEENSNAAANTLQLHTEKAHEADSTVGPLRTLPPDHRRGRLSISHKREFFQL